MAATVISDYKIDFKPRMIKTHEDHYIMIKKSIGKM